jgi:hypothetical protein
MSEPPKTLSEIEESILDIVEQQQTLVVAWRENAKLISRVLTAMEAHSAILKDLTLAQMKNQKDKTNEQA